MVWAVYKLHTSCIWVAHSLITRLLFLNPPFDEHILQVGILMLIQ